MKRILIFSFLFLALFVCPQKMAAQIKSLYQEHVDMSRIDGVVRDSSGQGYVPFAHLFFIHQNDTVPLVASAYGHFTYRDYIADSMRIRVTAVGFKPFEQTYYPKKHGFNIQICLTQDVVALNEIIIQGKVVAMVVKGDTLKYNAEAFTALDGDFMDVLLKKMPGVKYNGGSLSVNGEPIAKIYVNGDDKLFRSTGEAIKNIEADNVKDIQVYDERKKEDQQLGLKYGERQTVMNVTTKKKVEAIKRNSFTFSGGGDISDGISSIKGKYSAMLYSDILYPTKKININGMYSNWSPALTVDGKQAKASVSYNKNWKNNLNYTTTNQYSYRSNYSSRQGVYNYFPTDEFDTRTYRYLQENNTKEYSYRTDHRFFGFGKWGMLQCSGYYEFRGEQTNNKESNSSSMNNVETGSAQVADFNKKDQSHVYGYLDYTYTLPGKIQLNFSGKLDWLDGDGDGGRVDTIPTSTLHTQLKKENDYNKKEWSSSLGLSKALNPLWKLMVGGAYTFQKEQGDYLFFDLLTNRIDSTNTRNYAITYKRTSGSMSLNYFASKSHFYIGVGVQNIQREHLEVFPRAYEEVEDFCFFTTNVNYSNKFSPTSNLTFKYSVTQKLPTVEETRAAINDVNPLSLRAGNPNIEIPREHTAEFSFNQMFVKTSASFEVLLKYQLTEDYIATNSQYFAESTFLPEYHYTVMPGAMLYTSQNAGEAQLLKANVSYSKLSEWLKSNVKVSLGYQYQNVPSFSQGQKNNWVQNQGSFAFDLISNFSRKVEITLSSKSELSRNKSTLSESSNLFKEDANVSLRTTVIPKYSVSTSLRCKYDKQLSTGEDTYTKTLEASVSRKIGKQAHLSIDGYNLLDTRDGKALNKTGEYISYSQTSYTGRCVLMSLTVNF